MENLYAAYLSQPVINGKKFDAIHEVVEDTMKEYKIEHGLLEHNGFADGTITLTLTVDAEEKDDKLKMAQEFPAECVKSLLAYKLDNSKVPMIGAISYAGYTVEPAEKSEEAKDDAKEQTIFSLTLKLNGRKSAYVPEGEESETAE